MLAGLVAVVVGAVVVAGAIAALETWASQDHDGPAQVDEVAAPPGDDVFAAPRADSRPPVVELPFARDLSAILDVGRGLSAGHAAWTRAWPPLFVGGWILALLDANGNGGGGGGDTAEAAEVGSLQAADPVAELLAEPAFLVPMILGLLVCVAALAAVRAWIATGWIRVHREVLVEGASGFGTLFGGGDRVLAMIGWRIVRFCVLAPLGALAVGPALATLASGYLVSPEQLDTTALIVSGGLGVLLAFPAWLWIGPGLLFGEPFVVLDEDGPLDALRRSWRAARGNRVSLVVFYVLLAIVQAIVTVSGLLLLCVGFLVTVPYARAIVDVAWTRAWLLARHGEDASASWAVP